MLLAGCNDQFFNPTNDTENIKANEILLSVYTFVMEVKYCCLGFGQCFHIALHHIVRITLLSYFTNKYFLSWLVPYSFKYVY